MAMLSKLRDFFHNEPGSLRLGGAEGDLRVAVCAILLEAAEVDQEVAESERRLVRALLREEFELSDAEVDDLIDLTHKARRDASDLWPFTTAIAREWLPAQKRDLLVMVWRVIFADGRLDAYEDQLARKLQMMLSVNHSVLMEAKQLARAQTTGD
jgi:uncharacterized tellurite resistance protein B-like protein